MNDCLRTCSPPKDCRWTVMHLFSHHRIRDFGGTRITTSGQPSAVGTHGAVRDNRRESRIVAVSLNTSDATDRISRESRPSIQYATRMFLDVMRFHIQTDSARDLSLNVVHCFPIDAVTVIRPGAADAQQLQEQRSYCTAVHPS